MEIVSYKELESKGALLPLMEQAFGWPFEEREYAKIIKSDPRLREGAVGFCGVDDQKVLGFVGVMDLATRTADGNTEKAGGVFAVATLPGYTRRGICTRLLNRAHEYFRQKGYRFSLLTAGEPSVAHAVYCRLGYLEVATFRSAYKLKPKTATKEAPRAPEKARKWDLDRVLDLYAEYVRDRSGFVVRDKAYMKTLATQYGIRGRECITTKKGYVIFRREKTHARVRELVARDKHEMNRLIEQVEWQAQTVVVGRVPVGDPALSQVYRARGFAVLEKGHGVLMAKGLVPEASFADSYGSRFYMSALDHF